MIIMKKQIFWIITVTSFILFGFSAWPQQGKASITQGEFAKLLGEKLGYKEEPIEKLKKVGVTPLGEWNPEKPLTIEDVDAILIRIARRNPVVENIEPAKLLDSIGFPPRDISREWIKTLLESDVFKRTIINLRLLLSGPLLPLPLKYLKYVEIGAGGLKSEIAVAPVAEAAAIQESPIIEDKEPPSW